MLNHRSFLFHYTEPKRFCRQILNLEGFCPRMLNHNRFSVRLYKRKRFCSMILNVKRFCLIVLSYKKLSCSAEFLSVSVNIRSAKGFEREKMTCCGGQLISPLLCFFVFVIIPLLFFNLLYIARKPRTRCIFWYIYIEDHMEFEV
jgi:hypothetical protein